MAKNRIIAMTPIEKHTVLTLAASWRTVNMLRPRQYTPRKLCSSLISMPESPQNRAKVPTVTMAVVMPNWLIAPSSLSPVSVSGNPSRSRR